MYNICICIVIVYNGIYFLWTLNVYVGMLIIMLPHFTIPLILRKSDGGYGYDSTDMAALKYRLFDLKRDWIIYVTDEGQSGHFHMCFDAAKASKWVTGQRLNHIGFGVVCGDDGKRFRTRGSDTVRLIDLLDESKTRMTESLRTRVTEGKSSLTVCVHMYVWMHKCMHGCSQWWLSTYLLLSTTLFVGVTTS